MADAENQQNIKDDDQEHQLLPRPKRRRMGPRRRVEGLDALQEQTLRLMARDLQQIRQVLLVLMIADDDEDEDFFLQVLVLYQDVLQRHQALALYIPRQLDAIPIQHKDRVVDSFTPEQISGLLRVLEKILSEKPSIQL